MPILIGYFVSNFVLFLCGQNIFLAKYLNLPCAVFLPSSSSKQNRLKGLYVFVFRFMKTFRFIIQKKWKDRMFNGSLLYQGFGSVKLHQNVFVLISYYENIAI